MLNEWMQTGNVNEKELFVARFVLLKLACGRVQDARGLIEEYAPKLNYQIIHFIRTHYNFEQNLMRIIGLLIRAVEIKSEKAFDVLANDYRKTYIIDPNFESVKQFKIYFLKNI